MQDGTLVEDIKDLADKDDGKIAIHLNEEGTDPTNRETWLGWSEPEIIDKVVELNGQSINVGPKAVPKVQQNKFRTSIESPKAALYANLQGKTKTERDRMIMKAREEGKINETDAAKLSMKLNEMNQDHEDKDNEHVNESKGSMSR